MDGAKRPRNAHAILPAQPWPKLTLTLARLCKKAPGWGGRCQAEFTPAKTTSNRPRSKPALKILKYSKAILKNSKVLESNCGKF